MARFGFSWLGFLALTLAFAHTSAGWSQLATTAARPATTPAVKNDLTCTVYALKDLGDDPEFGKWVAETIPQVIQPGTWSQVEARHRISYYAHGKILVVYHNAAVQAEVAAFLENLKKALPQERPGASGPRGKMPAHDSSVTTASLSVPGSMPTLVGSSYPVPAPLQHPQHLFHLIVRAEGIGDLGTPGLIKDLSGGAVDVEDVKEQAKPEAAKGPRSNPSVTFILRYEGEGIIDNTVADVLKEIYGPKNAGKSAGEGCCTVPAYGAGVGAVLDALAGPTVTREATLPATRTMVPVDEPLPTRGTAPVPVPAPGPSSAPRSMPPAAEPAPGPANTPPSYYPQPTRGTSR
jgi:hypothetical protein